MSLQPQQDVNALLHNMQQQILVLTTQLAKLQANPLRQPPRRQHNLPNGGSSSKFGSRQIGMHLPTILRMQECYTAGVWPTWDNLKVEIKKYFKLQAERDWAHQQIRSFKQGNMRTDDFVTQFLALSIQGGLGNEHAVELLERNVNPHIAEQLYLQDMRNDDLSVAAEEVRKIGRAIELYKMHQGGGSTTKNNNSQRHPGSSNQKQHHSHGFQPFGLQPGRGAPMDIGAVQGGQKRRFTYFNCGQEGHMAHDCRNGVQAAQQKNNQGRQARQLETEKPDNRLNSLAGRLYDEIRAFFYDQQVNEMKAQGKEFRA
ncbi:hypothetical protein SERLA73DRAFT_67946 [Serpula lacrymans var. lacrymans S7.3]|uniref:CCHC-type domain-containing protein n=1 Tax=Serpula lacrymans var. lacrymans (strain S7.3) TaxID=936435 RepID=F8PFN7_SERL3|nr:hypothetical protein SERLA73DRAFT_67946 [Serpula lacrymans var. lacrymans S7.3]